MDRTRRLQDRVPSGRTLEEWLWELYHARGMTQQAIADLLGCNKSGVCRAMRRYGIPARQPQWVLPPLAFEGRGPRPSDAASPVDRPSASDPGVAPR